MKLRRLVSLNGKLKQEISTIDTGTVNDGDYGDITVSSSGTVWTIDANAVSLSKLAQLAALSVLGNPTNATANMQAITASSDYQVLRRSGTSIGFGSIDLSQSAVVGTSRLAYANIAQLAGLSVLGVTGASTADMAAITGTANQVLVINGAGTSLAFGQVNLSSPNAVTGTLGEGRGGTGSNSYTIGDILYASGVTTLSKLADVSAGSYLRSGGVSTAPLWSTLKLPNTATANYIAYATSSNTIGESGNLQFNGTDFSIGGTADGHRMKITAGTITDQKSALYITATLPTSPTTHNNFGVNMVITSAGSASFNQYALNAQLASGYTGSLSTYAIRAVNSAAGTGTFEPFVANTGQYYNASIAATSITSTTGSNYGYWNLTRSGAINCSMFGLVDVSRSNGKNYGVFGNVNAPTSGTSINVGSVGVAVNGSVMVGGFFGLLSSVPTLTSAALMCDNGSQAVDIFVARDNGTTKWSIVDGGHTTWADAVNMVFGTSTGTKIGTATSQKIGIWNATPIVQPTTAIAAATFVANTSAIANDSATFDGYTIGQVVKALRNFGILA